MNRAQWKAIRWQPHELRILTDNRHLSNHELALLLPGRTIDAISKRRGMTDLQTLRRRVWLSPDLRLMREVGQEESDQDIAMRIGRSQKAVALKRRKLGIVKDGSPRRRGPALLEDIHERARDCRISIKGVEGAINALGSLGASRWRRNRSVPLIAALAVELLGGELYAEWED